MPTLLAQQETRIYGGPDRGVRPGDAVIDCGAHVGVYVRTALDAGAKIVVAVEPAPQNIESPRWNFSQEIAAGQVVVYPQGVWDREEMLPLYSDPANSAGDSFIIRGGNDVVTAKGPAALGRGNSSCTSPGTQYVGKRARSSAPGHGMPRPYIPDGGHSLPLPATAGEKSRLGAALRFIS